MPKEAFEIYISQKQYSNKNLFICFNSGGQTYYAYMPGVHSVATCYLLFSFRGLTNQLEGKITGAKAGKTKLDTHRLNLCKSEVVSYVVFY